MKKTAVLLLVGAIIGSSITYARHIFPDVPDNIWYANSVHRLTDIGVIQGHPDGTYKPADNVNRAEVAAMMDRLLTFIEEGEVPDNGTGGPLVFERCRPMTNFEDEDWFSDLEIAYENEYLEEFNEDFDGTIGGEGCLSTNEEVFVFVPAFEENRDCRQILTYDIGNDTIQIVDDEEYCADDLRNVTDTYIEFVGEQDDDNSCISYMGRYHYNDDNIEVREIDFCGDIQAQLCTADPITLVNGTEMFPIATEYENLGPLGEFFTANVCGAARVESLRYVTNGIFTTDIAINLEDEPSEGLLTVLQEIGAECTEDDVEDAECTEWELTANVSRAQLARLEPFADEIASDD